MRKFLIVSGLLLISCIYSSCGMEIDSSPVSTISPEGGSSIPEEVPDETTIPSPSPTTPIETMETISEDVIQNSSRLITMTELGGGTIQHIDLLTGESLKMTGYAGLVQVLGFYDECTLILRINDKIVRSTLSGEVISELFSVSHLDDEFLYKTSISPDNSFLAYTLGKGYLDYDRFDNQDIFILDVNGEINQLTMNGGAWKGEWSNDGSQLAFSDYDENGYQQLFAYEINEQRKIQLTDFQGEVTEIRKIIWAGDDQKILVEIFDENIQGELMVIDLSGSNIILLRILGFSQYKEFWWKDDFEILVHARSRDEADEAGLFLLDVRTSNILAQVLESEYSNQPFVLVRPLNLPGLAGFFLENTFYIYNFDEGEMHKYVNVRKEMDLGDWLPFPQVESSLDYCEASFLD